MKKKDVKYIEGLRRKVAIAVDGGKKEGFKKASDLTLEVAVYLRNLGDREESIKEFKKVNDLYEKAREKTDKICALRAIAEMYSELGEQTQCHKYLDQFEKLVENDQTEMQLMLTVGAYCMIKLYTFYEKDETLLPLARTYAKKSLDLLNTVTLDPKKFLDGDSPVIRKINVHRMFCEIASYQSLQCSPQSLAFKDFKDEAERHSKDGYDLASNRKETRFEILRARIDFIWRDKIKASLDLVALAESMGKEKKIEAHTFLAQAYFEREEIKKGMDALFTVNETLSSKSTVEEEDREKYLQLLIFGYKASERVKRLQKYTKENDREGQYEQCDALGDLYSAAGFKEAALKYYRKSLGLAKEEQRRAALVSCAETCADSKLFAEAAKFFDQVRLEEIKLGKDTSETLARLFVMRLSGDFFKTNSDVNLEIDRLENAGNKFLNEVYNAAANYYTSKRMKEEAARFESLEEHFLEANKRDECSNDDEKDEKILDDIDGMDDNVILNKMREQAAQFAKKRLLAKQIRKTNQYGEAKLIERSREGTLDEVKHLIENLGANVNECDPVGWTPLSEAVSANNFDIVKYLLSKGANPNSQSKEGWMETNFAGKITPLMEACTNGFHEIARWLLNHKTANTLVVTTNLDGWSAADFLADYIKRARRGEEESEAEFREKLDDCKEVLELIKRMQRNQGFPVRTGDPPAPRAKTDDTPRFAAEKEKTRRAERSQRKRGAADEYEEVMTSVGSRGKHADKENKKMAKEREEEDLFNASDDEPLIIPSSSNKKQKRVTVLSSDEEEEDTEERRESMKENRRRRSLDFDNPNFGLEEEEEERSSSSFSMRSSNGGGSQIKKLSGVAMMLAKSKGKKRSTERGDENGISIVSDDIEIREPTKPKRRRQDSESSQSEAGSVHQLADRRHSINSLRDKSMDMGASSPIGIYRAESRSSLSSASALAYTGVQIVVVRAGKEPDPPFISKAPSDAEIADLPKHIERLRNTIDGESCEWRFQGMAVGTEEKLTLGDLAVMYNQPRLEIECRVRRTLKGDFQSKCDPSDRASPLSIALGNFEKSRTPSLVIGDGSKYSEKSLEALWQVLDEYVTEKRREDGTWRVESVSIDHCNVPAFALRTLIKMRPREGLSLRFCGLDDKRLEEMTEEIEATDLSRLNSLDLSYNIEISSSEVLAKAINSLKGLHTIILQGLSGIEDGMDMMKTLRELPKLTSLVLDENPWLDDSCMQEMIRGGGEAIGRLNQLKISKVAIRTMAWMANAEAFKSLKSLNLSENNGITPSGWERLAGFIRSTAALKTLDVKGTSVRPVILEALADRSLDDSNLTVTLTRCSGVTASEICRILGTLVQDARRALNLKVLIESEKVDEVRSIAPDLASKVLKAST